MKKFIWIFAALIAAYVITSCNKDEVETIHHELTLLRTEIRTDTVTVTETITITITDTIIKEKPIIVEVPKIIEVPVIVEVPTIIEVPVYVEVPVIVEVPVYIEVPTPGDTVFHIKDVKKVTVVAGSAKVDCNGKASFRVRIEYNDSYFKTEEKEYSYQLRNSIKGEALKNVKVGNLTVTPTTNSTALTTGMPTVSSNGIISMMIHKEFTQNFTQTVTSKVSMDEERAWIAVCGHIIEFPFVEYGVSFKNSEIPSTPSGTVIETGYETYPSKFNFKVDKNGTDCPAETVANDINLLKENKPGKQEIDRKINRYWKNISKAQGETSAYLVKYYDDNTKDSTQLGKFSIAYTPKLSADKTVDVTDLNAVSNIARVLIAREYTDTETNAGNGNFKRTARNGITTGTNKETLTSYMSWPVYRYEKDGIAFDYIIPDNKWEEVSNTLSSIATSGNYQTRTTTSVVSYGYDNLTNHTAKITYRKACATIEKTEVIRQWITLESKNFPSYYDSHNEYKYTWTDGSTTTDTKTERGTLTWNLAKNSEMTVTKEQFDAVATVNAAVGTNQIAVGSNLRTMTSSVTVGSVPTGFLRPAFTWSQVSNVIGNPTIDGLVGTKVNTASVKAAFESFSTDVHASTVTFKYTGDNKIEKTEVVKQWITFENKGYPSYYDSHNEYKYTWTDGSTTTDTDTKRGTLTWNLAQSSTMDVTQAQFNSVATVSPNAGANRIAVGSTLRLMESNVTVGNIAEGFLRPSFTWSQTGNAIGNPSTQGLVSTKVNTASVKAAYESFSTDVHTSTVTFKYTNDNKIEKTEVVRQWITLESRNFPTYYDSHNEYKYTWSDGSTTTDTKTERGSLTWNLAQSSTMDVTQTQFNSVATVSPNASVNRIAVGSNLRTMTSSVTVGSVPTGFLRPAFTWSQVSNVIGNPTVNGLASTRINAASVKAAFESFSTDVHSSAVTFKYTSDNKIEKTEVVRQWITFENRNFPSYYDSHNEYKYTWTDGSTTTDTKTGRGTLTWNLATDQTMTVNQPQFNSVATVNASNIANGISVGSNLKMLSSTVIVGSVASEFLRPSFTWSQTGNSIVDGADQGSAKVKVNNTSVRAAYSELSWSHSAKVTFLYTPEANDDLHYTQMYGGACAVWDKDEVFQGIVSVFIVGYNTNRSGDGIYVTKGNQVLSYYSWNEVNKPTERVVIVGSIAATSATYFPAVTQGKGTTNGIPMFPLLKSMNNNANCRTVSGVMLGHAGLLSLLEKSPTTTALTNSTTVKTGSGMSNSYSQPCTSNGSSSTMTGTNTFNYNN